ncbi:Nucleoporin NUP53 [Fusarium austroafricanum]|uniref:Nucleoporin NUP53 n=1 Tax=Fusarium austroafricanum TaxID=2364996 RepID=A0A8H4NWU3_9HYPO|nr:Nucleoporin NUP53 [Fusarium austroafricanum]
MAPLILHNVPDDECYVGDDGVKRPYAMYFNQQDAPQGSTRSRRSIAESGSFGKSTRRSRSRTGTPARSRENPTLAAADKLFGDWVTNQAAAAPTQTVQRKSSGMMQEEAPIPRAVTSHPVELILRGYRSSTQQYAAISHYESLAGTILEDYPREPPASQRRYKSELRDPAFTRRRNLTADERALVNRADGGEHWVKVTFESREAAEAATFASPQRILGHLVYAEPYRNVPPAKDEACPDIEITPDHSRSQSMPAAVSTNGRKSFSGPTSFNSRLLDLSPPRSQTSSFTMDTGTISNSHASTATITEPFPLPQATTSSIEPMQIRDEDSVFCRRIPTARRATILPAEQALLPQQTMMQRVINAIPFVKWFGGSMIGNEVPRTETGEFDWSKASLYWKLIWWLDATFGLFSGDVLNADKDD